ncbi:hypothetical protein K1T71_013768 [Dendrolimus kikuchii]|uniref:Uncharacterized protein n=1 Tax=Dendrolimus kikuchii TaxID=765133 RepID=A0ACC1CFY3_9NEOP|nr:hypothetical protein K1T71_013768 [Dendrolimus kikuchii]
MEEANKLPLKRVELSLTKFNEVAIPHHLDLLRQHKANIIKYEQNGDYARVRSEQMHARRVSSQLRTLLGEMEALRRQVRSDDWQQFDKRTQHSRDLTLKAIMDYLGVIESSCRALVSAARVEALEAHRSDTSPLVIERQGMEQAVAGSAVSTESVGLVHHGHPDEAQEPETPLLQLQLDQRELELRSREAALRGWRELQAEIRALHDAWQHVQAAAMAQRDQVALSAARVHVAAENVAVARGSLGAAERLKAGAMGAGGALVGALVGGPMGLVVGAKAGAAALVAGSLLGYVGGRLLGDRRRAQLAAPDGAPAAPDEHDKRA